MRWYANVERRLGQGDERIESLVGRLRWQLRRWDPTIATPVAQLEKWSEQASALQLPDRDVLVAGLDAREARKLQRKLNVLKLHLLNPRTHEVPEGVIVRPMSHGKGRGTWGGVRAPDGRWIYESRVLRGAESQVIIGPEEDAPEPDALGARDVSNERVVFGGYLFQHFGHFLLESFSRMWWMVENDNELPIYLQSTNGKVPGFAKRFFELAGVAERIHVLSRSTRFASVVVPGPAFTIRLRAHAAFQRLFDHVAERAIGRRRIRRTDQPLYLSRSSLRPPGRTLVGEVALERVLRNHGVRVVCPEKLPIEEQIRLVNTHRHVVAPIGTALHLLSFSLHPFSAYALTYGQPNVNYVLADVLGRGRTLFSKVSTDLPPFRFKMLPWEHLPVELDLLAVGDNLADWGILPPGALSAVAHAEALALRREYERQFFQSVFVWAAGKDRKYLFRHANDCVGDHIFDADVRRARDHALAKLELSDDFLSRKTPEVETTESVSVSS